MADTIFTPFSGSVLKLAAYGAVIGFFIYLIILKLLSVLLRFKDKSWKTSAKVSLIFAIIGFLLTATGNKLIGYLNLIVLIFLIRYIYKEKWTKSILTVVITFFIGIFLSLILTGLMALILLKTISP